MLEHNNPTASSSERASGRSDVREEVRRLSGGNKITSGCRPAPGPPGPTKLGLTNGCLMLVQMHSEARGVLLVVVRTTPAPFRLLKRCTNPLRLWNLGEKTTGKTRNGRDAPPAPPPPPPPPRHLEQEVELWGRGRDELHHRIYSQQPIEGWEGRPAHTYGEIVFSSLVSLYSRHTKETSQHFLVLFPFHLLILSLDHMRRDFIYQGILPLSALSFKATALDPDTHSHMFEISGPMVDPKVFACSGPAELRKWMKNLEERRYKSVSRPLSPAQCPLSYLMPCDERWKREELKKYLLQALIWQWEGSPIRHMGPAGYLSVVHVTNAQRQGPQERLMVLFPQDVLLLSVDNRRLNIRYEGRFPRQGIKAVERSALPGRLEFELTGDLVEPLQVSCTGPEDYENWIFHLQQPEKDGQVAVSHSGPPIMPKLQKSRKESREPVVKVDQRHANGWT